MNDNMQAEALLGVWLGRGEAGELKAEFKEDGSLVYTITQGENEFKILLNFRVENNDLIITQPSSSKQEKTRFTMTEDNKLILEKATETWIFRRA